MSNPFRKRATEYISEPVSLLPLVSPRPIDEFLKKDGEAVFEKLTVIVGSPGCGKTTIARVMEYDCLNELRENPDHSEALAAVLHQHKAMIDGRPALIGHLLPMTSEFRAIWELPYPVSLRNALLRAFVQSKAVLGWFRRLVGAGISIDEIEVLVRRDTESARLVHQAESAEKFRERAREVEMAIFKIVTALVAPKEEELSKEFLEMRYDIFEILSGFRVHGRGESSADGSWTLKPLIIIDDAHELHSNQYVQLRDWLKSRVIGSARWIMCRPDVVAPEDFREALLEDSTDSPLPSGTTRGRDYILRLIQLGSRETKKFRPIAKEIANKYLMTMPEMVGRANDIERMLDTPAMQIAPGQIKFIREAVDARARESKFGEGVLTSLAERIPASAKDDERVQTLRILLERERNKTPQISLIDLDPIEEPVSDDRQARADVVDGARIQLMHEFGRPYYYGFDKLADASNANIEQFITLCSSLIDVVLAQIVRGKPVAMKAKTQHESLVKRSKEIIKEWDFPYHIQVHELVEMIGRRCVETTTKLNAPLSDGANAIGIPQSDFDNLSRSDRFARVLHFAFAYKALTLVPNYRCKGKEWALLELGGIPCMAYGLTLGRGGFIEDRLSGLQSKMGWGA